ncbi:MAG: four helix bundle protein [Bacteroides sp. SM23_62_1]|nr:MAG: four helix bundle protein [Bacteroides sp. SM23_62_1]
MATIKKFEELECWKKCRELCKKVYELTNKEKFSKDFSLVWQVRKSSGSAMDNIPEGFERGGNKEFINFLGISRGSLAELKSQLYRALDQEYIDENEFKDTYDLASECSKLVTGLINYLKNSK